MEERGPEPGTPVVSRRSSAAWNAFFGYATIGIALVRNIVLVPIYLHFIKLDEFGAWMASGGALVNLFVIDFGLSGALTQRVSQFLGSGELQRLGRSLVAGLLASAILAVLLSSTALLAAPHVPLFAGLSSDSRTRVIQCFELAIVTGGVGIVNSTLLGLLRSFHRPAIAGLANVVSDLIGVAVTIVLLVKGFGLYALATGLLVRSLCVFTATAVGLRREIASRVHLRLELVGHEFRTLMSGSVYWFTASLSMKIQANANTVVVASALGPGAAATYGLTVRAHETLQALLIEIAHAVTPSMAHLYGEGNLARLKDVSARLLVVLAALSGVALAVAVTCDYSFVRLWVGAGLYAGDAVSGLIAMSIWISLMGHVGYDAVQARGEFRTIAGVYASTAVLHVLLLFALVRLGAWGAPAASVVSASAFALLFWRKVGSIMPFSRAETRLAVRTVCGIGAVCALLAWGGLHVAVPAGTTWATFVLRATVWLAVCVAGVYAAAPHAVAVFREEIALTLRRKAKR